MTISLPDTAATPVVRTAFGNDAAWEALKAAVAEPQDEFAANVSFVDDPALDGADPAEVAHAARSRGLHAVVLIADFETFASPDRVLLCVDALEEPVRSFRFVPAQAWSVENNLSLANMDFDDFLGSLGPDGFFRGFPGE